MIGGVFLIRYFFINIDHYLVHIISKDISFMETKTKANINLYIIPAYLYNNKDQYDFIIFLK